MKKEMKKEVRKFILILDGISCDSYIIYRKDKDMIYVTSISKHNIDGHIENKF